MIHLLSCNPTCMCVLLDDIKYDKALNQSFVCIHNILVGYIGLLVNIGTLVTI